MNGAREVVQDVQFTQHASPIRSCAPHRTLLFQASIVKLGADVKSLLDPGIPTKLFPIPTVRVKGKDESLVWTEFVM